MSRFLFTVWPFTGHIHPNLAIAHELRNLGHEAAFYSGSSAKAAIEGAGFPLFPLSSVDEKLIDEIVLSPRGILAAGRNPFRMRSQWRQCVLDTVPGQLEDLSKVLSAWNPDAIVCDPMMWAPFLILHETRCIPVAMFSLIPACHLSGQDGPILGFPLPRARNAVERFRNRVLRGLSDRFLAGVRRQASRLREASGLTPLPCSVTDFAGRMPLYLVPGSPEFDYSRNDLPVSVHYVGPCLLNGNKQDELPDWIQRLPADQPLVYASEGTVHLEPIVLRAVAQGLAGLPIQVILTTGRHRDPATLDLGLSGIPSNIHVERWVPMQPLLPRLSAVITIGGPSTMMAAFEASVPVVVVPFTWDHPETAWRVQESGAGVRLSPKECTPDRMRHAVQRILGDQSFRANARRLAVSFQQCGGAPAAASLIANLAVPALSH